MTTICVLMVVTHLVSDYRERTINVKISSSAHTGNSIGTKKINLSEWPHSISFFQANPSFSISVLAN